VRSVRGIGLLLAAELAAGQSRPVVAEALTRGLVVNAVTSSAVRLAPPLLVSDDEIDEALAILAAVLPR
ncbi:MAG: aminotransferase class III-fold pyridoxal phosphate-dependent enzyme, partial [Actinomycetota bacterium]|nr:aminotransferase class III-fold pyridoxal phosphate-dependent enzyme [Actinomycetota bacterium]